ncbi:ammonia-dependent NAD(+) synthetase [Fictibacillus nanhaiensis]|uniref:ammonia-dependent NAD(+) synthetase n=1 Tax=Fictibacillus nanhaiensis TaxID=742169 RepID=UPI002E1EBFD8|nr:ammonia-dependent NAD(+) synthetase [Fictibacillus nanhaiensis]MED1864888.1 ammonia-dependent NAD(+) synthetase [Fictibacillus nanhaiensis]
MSLQQRIMSDLNTKSNIDASTEIQSRINFLKDYLIKSGAKGFVLGISGGQDSTLAGRLAQIAVEELRGLGHIVKFVAVRLPYGIQRDEEDAELALSFINPDQRISFDVKETVDVFAKNYKTYASQPLTDFNKGNVKARVRMITQYAVAGQTNLLVIGTDHAAEAITGFFTKYGDGGADILPLAGLTKRQGKMLLKELGAPERLYVKQPTADLLDEKPQQADETELGITYDDLDDYLEGKVVSDQTAKKIEERYLKTEHKRQLPASPHDEWWQ